MIVHKPLEEIPHFFSDEKKTWKAFTDWTDFEKIPLINILYAGETPFEDVITACKLNNGKIPYILGGLSGNGFNHSVVVQGNRVFDPAINDAGIVGPMDTGYYHITYMMGNFLWQ